MGGCGVRRREVTTIAAPSRRRRCEVAEGPWRRWQRLAAPWKPPPRSVIPGPVSKPTEARPFDSRSAKTRLLQLVRERAYKDGLDIVLASGKRSTFYINGKKVSLHPEGLWLIAKLLLEKLKAHPEVTAVGGLTIGADPLASAVAALSFETGQNLSAFLVRKEAKGHGTGSRIEGDLAPGQKVAILEDTVTTGGSAKKAIEAVREVGAVPVVVMAIADREDPDADAFRKEFRVECLLTLGEIRGN
jgi:orotate phosphoribosyltransferase